MFAATDPDRVVEVKSGPVTIFVIQGGRVRAMVECPKPGGGTVTVPITALSSTGDPIFVGVMPGLIPDAESDALAKVKCPHCLSPNPLVPCCP
jgi:hypothetical protein